MVLKAWKSESMALVPGSRISEDKRTSKRQEERDGETGNEKGRGEEERDKGEETFTFYQECIAELSTHSCNDGIDPFPFGLIIF